MGPLCGMVQSVVKPVATFLHVNPYYLPSSRARLVMLAPGMIELSAAHDGGFAIPSPIASSRTHRTLKDKEGSLVVSKLPAIVTSIPEFVHNDAFVHDFHIKLLMVRACVVLRVAARRRFDSCACVLLPQRYLGDLQAQLKPTLGPTLLLCCMDKHSGASAAVHAASLNPLRCVRAGHQWRLCLCSRLW